MQDLTLKEAEAIALSILKQVMEEKVKKLYSALYNVKFVYIYERRNFCLFSLEVQIV